MFKQRTRSVSNWFGYFLRDLGIYEKHSTCLHSFRGTAIDMWRRARIPEDVRRALTAHSSADIQEKSYGENLKMMPDVLYKEIAKVDLSWLP